MSGLMFCHGRMQSILMNLNLNCMSDNDGTWESVFDEILNWKPQMVEFHSQIIFTTVLFPLREWICG